MKALILNSGMGQRMGDLTKSQPKCMTEMINGETIISRQLKQLKKFKINEVIITTGYFDDVLRDYIESLNLGIQITYIRNPLYDKTNYIYSIYCAKELLKDTDLILMHGDLVFSDEVLESVIKNKYSCMTTSSTLDLPQKDFKAVVSDGKILKVGIEFFENALAAQPLYKLLWKDWSIWLDSIDAFCKSNKVNCYAENAFNEVSDICNIFSHDVKDSLCAEIDNPEDLEKINKELLSK